MHTMIRWIRKLKIEKRLRTFFFLASIVPVLILGICSAAGSYEDMKEMAVDYSAAMADISLGNMEQHFSKYLSQIEAVEESSALLQRISSYNSADWDEKKQTENDMRLLVNSIFGQNQEVDTVEISSADGAKFYYPSPITKKGSPLLAETEVLDGPLWSFIPKETGADKENYIVISKAMKPYGTIVLALKKDYAETLCENAGAGKQWKTAIFDGSGALVAGEDAFDRASGADGAVVFTEQGKMFTSGHVISSMQWKIVNGVPYSYLLDGVYQQIGVLFALLAAGILVVFYLSKIMTASITEPLGKLTKAMERDGWKELLTDEGRDEYHELIQGFNQMNERLGHMGNEVLQMELKESRLERIKKETELSALQKQINPHFLYNTLETIYWNGQYEGAEEISDVVIAVGNYFRTIISKGQEYTTVGQEAKSVENYLFLQNLRFGGRIRIWWDIREGTEDCRVMKLILQPVMEDMINEALEEKAKEIQFCVEGKREGSQVRFFISGVTRNPTEGFRKIQELPGCGNVNQRLKLYFGQHYGVTIEENGICILVPVKEEET